MPKQRRTVIYSTKDGQIAVVREESIGQIWKPLDRFITQQLGQLQHKKPNKWMVEFIEQLKTWTTPDKGLLDVEAA